MDTGLTPNPRIAIYSQDGYGLGHMRRTSAIAWQIFQIRPDASLLTISDSQLGQFFRISPNHDYLKLPSIVKDGPGKWRAPHLPIPFEEVLEMRRQLIRSTLVAYAPNIVLVDHMPHGAMQELLPALSALKDSRTPPFTILGLRDILDAPDVIKHRWQEEGAYSAAEEFYDRILVYGMRDVYNVEEKYQFTDRLAQMVRYTGYVSSKEKSVSAAKIRARYLAGTPAGTRLIVAMAGGGADAHTMMSNLLEAVPAILREQRCVLAMITGPFMPENLRADLNKRARGLPVRIMESVPDTLSFISAADLVVAMAGYNTSVEILRMRKPAIFIPRAGPSAEQRTRSRLFAARHWVDQIDPDDLTPELLAEKANQRLRCGGEQKMPYRPDLHGGIVAANQILTLLWSPNGPSVRPAAEPLPDSSQVK